MIRQIDISEEEVAKIVLPMQMEAYKVEADIIDYADLPPLKDTIESLQACGEAFFGYFEEQALCGVISLKFEHGILDIHRLMVHPMHFRKGISQQLMNYVLQTFNVRCVKVSTGSRNIPAICFYVKNGFYIVDEIDINDELSLTLFEKRIPEAR